MMVAFGAALCGVISAMGIGGGTLLLIFMTNLLGVAQLEAQFINILYFIPTALVAGFLHYKNGFVDKEVLLWCVPFGSIGAVIGSVGANSIDPVGLRLYFNWLLIGVGIYQLVQKREKPKKK